MTAGPIFDLQRAKLGRERLDTFTRGHATLQGMAMFLVMSTMSVPQVEYSDAALEALKQDAQDVRDAADRWASDCEALVDHWRAQREATSR